MTKRYEPRNLTTEQQNYRVDLHAKFGGSYGYGETLVEAEKNAKFFFKRDFAPQKPRCKVVQRWQEDHWSLVLPTQAIGG